MQMYEVTVLSEDMQTQLLVKVIFAEDEDDALDRMEEELRQSGIAYGMCQASEI